MDPEDSRYLHLSGSVSSDWSVEDGVPIVPCWVCAYPMMGRQRLQDDYPGSPLIGKCDRVFLLRLGHGEDLDGEGDEIQEWMMCDPECWVKARDLIQKIVEEASTHKPIFTSWSADFQELTGLDE